eukprot:TRINITY_DN54141_c0_g1_i1.p1 TRINITY_DN54141_c0_g1~~TRINITY_DN54141_c0_g1_i1.p1  ORF type:complete len:995 (+),score=174.28 TRINITY_DN54141_c0_g1_i1:313-2985(+)
MIEHAETESVVIQCQHCSSLVEGPAALVTRELVLVVNRTVTSEDRTRGWISAVTSYYDIPSLVQPNPLLSTDGRTMLYQWRWTIPEGSQADAIAAADRVIAVAKAFVRSPDAAALGLQVLFGGPLATHRDVMVANKQDSGAHSVAFLPVMLALLAVRVRSVALALVTVINVIGAMLTSFCLVSFLCDVVSVYTLAPSMICFFTISLSVDYSLFMLSRYAEERRAGATYRPALEAMVANSGHVVLISGSVVSLAAASGVTLPGGFRGMALAIASACFGAMAWNILLTPALIGSLPAFFDRCSGWRRISSSSRLMRAETRDASWDAIEESLVRSPWFKWATLMTRWPVNLMVVISIFALATPLALVAFAYEPSIDVVLAEPRGAPASVANAIIREEFFSGLGCPSPLYVLVRPRPSATCPATVRSNAFFASACVFAQRLLAEAAAEEEAALRLTPGSLLGIAFHPAAQSNMSAEQLQCIPWEDNPFDPTPDAYSFVTGHGFFDDRGQALRSYYMKLWASMVSADSHATLVAIAPRVDASTPDGYRQVQRLRRLLRDFNSGTASRLPSTYGGWVPPCELEAYMLSQASTVRDFQRAAYQRYPFAFAATLLPCFLLLGCAFGAILVPLKLLLTVAMPVAWSYGVVISIYQFGALNGLGIQSLQSESGLFWSVPVMTCTFLLGLGLDYDLIVFSRIWELRSEGYTTVDAIRLGVASMGSTITSAGVIFCLEMFGALLSNVPVVNQTGAVIMISALLDIAVVETCFVPALLSLGAELNWWPVKMPHPTRSLRSPCSADVQSDTADAVVELALNGDESAELVPMLGDTDYDRVVSPSAEAAQDSELVRAATAQSSVFHSAVSVLTAPVATPSNSGAGAEAAVATRFAESSGRWEDQF